MSAAGKLAASITTRNVTKTNNNKKNNKIMYHRNEASHIHQDQIHGLFHVSHVSHVEDARPLISNKFVNQSENKTCDTLWKGKIHLKILRYGPTLNERPLRVKA